jgi:protein SCO1/2
VFRKCKNAARFFIEVANDRSASAARLGDIVRLVQARICHRIRTNMKSALPGTPLLAWTCIAVLGGALGGAALADNGDEHAAHRAAARAAANASAALQVARADYQVPDLTLQDAHGRAVRLRQLLADDQPLVVNFIYTSCTTLCPVMTATMLQLQHELMNGAPAPRYVSISVDPDFDSAAVLGSYATRFHADWTFLTGERDTVLQVLQAFGAWRGAKSNHVALTLMRRPGDSQWLRIEGLSSASQLAQLWRGRRES